MSGAKNWRKFRQVVLASQPRQRAPIILEVERKFPSLAVDPLTPDGGKPHFYDLQELPEKTFHDMYYDRSDLLSAAGMWVRQRDGRWQAKFDKGGNFSNSRFEETEDLGEIKDRVLDVLSRARLRGTLSLERSELKKHFGLVPMADFVTTRKRWLANGEFEIVLDRTNFGHTVGEVELQQEVPSGDWGEGPSEDFKRETMQDMDERIVEFMKRYSWAFSLGEPVGKLTAYFKLMREKEGSANSD